MRKLTSIILTAILLLSSFTLAINANNSNAEPKVKVDIQKIDNQQKDSTIKVIYPVFSGFSAASKLNDSIQNKIITSIGCAGDAASSIQEIKKEQQAAGQEIPDYKVSLDINFDYSTYGNILSVMMNEYSYYGGAHGSYSTYSITANIKTGEIYTFNALFNQKSSYKKVILSKINALIDKQKSWYFDDAKQTVAKMNTNFQFYLDGSNLVIYFDLYTLRPYAAGMPEFKIPAKDLKGLLKDEVYSQMIKAKPLGNFRMNGTTFNVPEKTFKQNYSLMVPLKFFANTLGYSVSWTASKGACVAGGYIKNGINSYYTEATKGTPKKLSSAPTTIVGRYYVPIEYFWEVLKEDVSYNGETVRIYKGTSTGTSIAESLFNKQIAEFEFPSSEKECVEMYAKAVEDRKGAIQYALYSEKLRAATKSNFEEMNWVTGVSSPWVTGYDIKKTGTGAYDIIFHWATSAGKEPDSTTKLTVQKIPGYEFWQITDVKE